MSAPHTRKPGRAERLETVARGLLALLLLVAATWNFAANEGFEASSWQQLLTR